MKKTRKILIIVQRSNGDVFLSNSLIANLHGHFESVEIDLLVNDDTYQSARLLSHINKIYTFSYEKKSENRWKQEKEIIYSIIKKYDLSINLTSSDRSVLYALIAGRKAVSIIERDLKKSWWKRLFLTQYYYYDSSQHILKQNLTPLALLGIKFDLQQLRVKIRPEILNQVKQKLNKQGIEKFIIFHPSAQYSYKIFPKDSRVILLEYLSNLGIPIVITGSKNLIDSEIKANLPCLPNIYDFIGETSLEEYTALSSLSDAYIGMDTLNMHISASQDKRIFAIFGPTNLSMWSPWSNDLKTSASDNMPLQTYSKITIFQADMPCVACGLAGCDNKHGKSECLYRISPISIFNEVEKWFKKLSSKKNEEL